MVFEQAYGHWLVNELNARIQNININLKCKFYDEMGYKPLYNEPDVIAVVVSGGNASRSVVRGQDQNVLPLTVTIICKSVYSSPVRNAIDCMQKDFNAVPLQLEYYDAVSENKITVNLKSIFTTPFVFDESDFATKRETIKATFIPFSASVSYGETAVVEPMSAQLKIDGETFEIGHIVDCNKSSMPSYEAYLPQGTERLYQAELSRASAFAFTLYKVDGDKFQDILDNELLCLEDGLHGKELVLILGEQEIPVKTYQLNDQYVNNAAAYCLTLGW